MHGANDDAADRASARPLVLVAEDDAVNQRVCVEMLKRLGYDTLVVANGLEALVAFEPGRFVAGGMIPLSEFIWASFFGRRFIGAVRGTALPITVIVAGSGPQIVGYFRDQVGDYDGAFLGMAAAWTVAGIVVALLRRPPPKVVAAPSA